MLSGNFDVRMAVVSFITLVLSICVHEFGHAFIADRLGDSLPRRQGRVTLNPLVHADPIGTIALPLFMLIFSGSIGFGWGKPVMVQPSAMTRKLHMRTAHLFVAAAGPFMNVLFAAFIGVVTLLLLKTGVLSPYAEIYPALLTAIFMNCILAFFNLIPAPPLDGGTVLEGLLPTRALPTWHKLTPYGPLVLIAVLLIPQIQRIFTIPAGYLFRGICQLLGLPT
jgi:Zn-dependent protease